jgi:hypothetical protein
MHAYACNQLPAVLCVQYRPPDPHTHVARFPLLSPLSLVSCVLCVSAGTEQHRMREAGVVGGGSAMGHTGTHSEYHAVQRLLLTPVVPVCLAVSGLSVLQRCTSTKASHAGCRIVFTTSAC